MPIRYWWDHLVLFVPKFGDFPNATKTIIITKDEAKDKAADAFKDTGIKITVAGNLYLGGALGVESFLEKYIEDKVSTWRMEIE